MIHGRRGASFAAVNGEAEQGGGDE